VYDCPGGKIFMKKALILAALLAVGGLAGGVVKADTCSPTDCTSAGGVTYTFTQGGSDGAGVFDIVMTIDTTGATASGTLHSFSVQFTGASSVTLDSVPPSTGSWAGEGMHSNDAKGCNLKSKGNHWCFDGGTIGVTSGAAGGTFKFVFDVTGVDPTATHIQAFQGGPLAISNDSGIGPSGPPPSVPEPASLTLLGLSLMGVPFLRRRK
jgi:hypothetical protein